MTTPDVTVEVEGNDAPPVSDDTVVVVTGQDEDNGNDLAIGVALGELAVTVQALQSEVAEMRGQIASAQTSAEIATDIAVDASVTATEAVEEAEAAAEEAEEAAADATDEVIEPDREHWLWKKRGGLKPVSD